MTNINSTNEMSIEQFLEKLASKAPTPGGGGAAALVGAVGIALGNMTGSLTVGKKKYAAVEKEMIELNEKAEMLREQLYELIEKDAQAFMPVSKAYGIPKDDPNRDDIMEEALKGAVTVPCEIVVECCEALEIIKEYADKGSVIAISDAGCAVSMCKAAMESAALNVYVNTKLMKDREYAEELNAKVRKMLEKYLALAGEVYESVERRLL